MNVFLTVREAETVKALLDQEADDLAKEWQDNRVKERVRYLRLIAGKLNKSEKGEEKR